MLRVACDPSPGAIEPGESIRGFLVACVGESLPDSSGTGEVTLP
jgi:hypothetical protein